MSVLEQLGADALRHTIVTYRDTLKRHQADLNSLNVYPVPDGDTGTNMARTLDAVVAELDRAPAALDDTCKAISHGSLMGARGNSGVILSQILRGVAATMRDATSHGAPKVAEALKAAASAAYEAVLKPIEGTILTVVRETADAASRAAEEGATLAAMLRVARAAGRESLARTPELLPVLKEAGVVDAGGAGFLLLLDAALHVVDGEPLPEPTGVTAAVVNTASISKDLDDHSTNVADLRYEVMFLLDIDDAVVRDFKNRWGEIGDSIVVVGGERLYNCHVHTNDIGAAIEAPIQLGGRPYNIRVTDLFEEVAEEHERREAAIGTPEHKPNAALPPVTCAVVAVASGDGIAELFGQMGVHGVVTGGQTLNPSTQELLDAVEHMNAANIVVLPNNKNIIAVANQLASLTKKRIEVVPTCSMPEALAALVHYDPEADAATNAAAMNAAISGVATGEVTFAVRDTTSDIGPITAGHAIGLLRGDGVVSTSPDVFDCVTSLLDQLVTPERELVTIITGVDADAVVTSRIVEWLSANRADAAVEVHRGGQPLYPYLFGVE